MKRFEFTEQESEYIYHGLMYYASLAQAGDLPFLSNVHRAVMDKLKLSKIDCTLENMIKESVRQLNEE